MDEETQLWIAVYSGEVAHRSTYFCEQSRAEANKLAEQAVEDLRAWKAKQFLAPLPHQPRGER